MNATRGQVDALAVHPLTGDSVTEADFQRYFQDTRQTPRSGTATCSSSPFPDPVVARYGHHVLLRAG